MLGLPNPKKFAPHCLRSYMITKVANGKGKYSNIFLVFFFIYFLTGFFLVFSFPLIVLGVSDQERMDSCRHDSAATNIIYQERDSTSEANKFIALGIRPSKKMRLDDHKLITPESSTPVPKPTSTPPNKKLHYYEISLTPPAPQIKTTSSPSTLTQPTEYSHTQPTDDYLTQDAIPVV